MPLIHTLTILICLAALFSYLNHRLLKLPITIGLMAVALVFSLVLLALGKLGLGVEAEAPTTRVAKIDPYTRRYCGPRC